MNTPGQLSVDCVVMLVLSGLLISCPTVAEAEEARICVTTYGFSLGPAISCKSGYLIDVTGAEYLNLNSSLCGVNVCPCDHATCRVDLNRVDGGSHYNSVISHCQYKAQCETMTLPRTSVSPCRNSALLLIHYRCIDEARICVTLEGFALGPAISCTSGYLINIIGAEYLDLDSSLCGINVCPCDHVTCRVDVDTVDGGSPYQSIISHCQYKPQCETVMLPRTATPLCRGAALLLIRYTCFDDPIFPDTPMTTSNVIATEESPTSDFIATEGSSTPPTTDDVTISITGAEIPGDSSVSGALLGVSVMAALLIVAVLVLTVCLVISCRKTAAQQKELSAMRTTPTAANAAMSSATNHVTPPVGPYETLETTPQAARHEGDGSATYSELTEAAAYMNMAAGRSREQSGSEPGGPERSAAASYVNMAAGRTTAGDVTRP